MKYFGTFLFLIAIIILSQVVTQAFASCAQNEDWPDAPCFDTLPVNRDEYREKWAPYHDYKGSEFMEAKKAELLQAIKDGTFMEWEGSAENSNVYQYYHSVGLVPNQYEYFFFEDEAQYRQYLAPNLVLFFVIAGIVGGLAAAGVFIVRRKRK